MPHRTAQSLTPSGRRRKVVVDMFGGVNAPGMSRRDVQTILSAIEQLKSELVAGDISTLLCEQGGEILATQDGIEIMAHRII